VYRNAAGFLRIYNNNSDEDGNNNPLDSTRIHPESYELAVKMCTDALDIDDNLDPDDPFAYKEHVSEILDKSRESVIKVRMRLVPLV
jgi:transcription elongation factor SPT6